MSLRALGWEERALGPGDGGRVSAAALSAASEASAAADRVYVTSRALHDEAAELRRRAQYELRPRLVALRGGDSALGATQELGNHLQFSRHTTNHRFYLAT